MLTMDRINDIRLRYYVKGENISQIASKLQLDWKTVPMVENHFSHC